MNSNVKTNILVVSLSQMKVDMSYQRPVDGKRVNAIAAKWDPMKANLIHVSERADGYYVMDGNHTRLAAVQAGQTELICRVYQNLTVQDEARTFSELNSLQKKPKFAEILRARAAAGCEPERTYFQLFDDAGVKYTMPFRHAGGTEIQCHSSLFAVYKKTNYDLMLRAMKTAIRAADGREDFYRVGFFPGLCSLIVLHPEIDDMRLIAVVRKATAPRVRDIASLYKKANTTGTSNSTKEYMNAYIDLYNKGKRKNKIEK